MDPLAELCQVRDSFENKIDIRKIEKYSENYLGSPRSRRNEIIGEFDMKFEFPKFEKFYSSLETNFERSGLVLADIDTNYNFSRQENGYLIPQVLNEQYSYAVLNADLGYLQYLIFRLPESTGFTKCTNFENIKLNKSCDSNILKYIQDIQPEGVDLVIGNDLTDLKIAIQISKPGATFINKIEEIDIQLLYIITMVYRKFSLFCPFLNNEENIFIIAEDFIGNALDYVSLIEKSKEIKVSEQFIKYVSEQLKEISLISYQNEYNLYRCKALMNI